MRTIITAAHLGIGLAFFICTPPLFANPTGGVVVGGPGNATIDGQGSPITTINQSVNRVVINWQDFSIGSGELTRFVQPSSTAIALNRVMSGNASRIYGSLEANGRVFVINPNGILVGPSGHIDTKGFVASTLNVPDASFLSGGNLIFSGNSTAPIRNDGTIQALGGNVFLIAHTVDNAGTILAPQGTVGLAAGSQVQLVQSGNEHVSVLAGNSSAPAAVGVNNSGTIEGAQVELKAAGGNIYALAINNGGTVRANGIVHENGHIYLRAGGGNIENSGTLSANNADGSGGTVVLDGGHNDAAPSTVINSGTITARGDTAGAKGGTVEVLGDHVSLAGGALVDVSGDAGGGMALIGGDTHGANPAIQNSQQTEVSAGATIRADALSQGNGGKVVVWSDGSTDFHGAISGVGAGAGGNGGSAEVSGNHLRVDGTVDLSSPSGQTGQLLLDPAGDLTVAATDPGDGSSFVDVTTIDTAAANKLLQTDGNIFFNAPVLMANNGIGITAQAGNNVNVNNSITTRGGSVVLSANDNWDLTKSGSGSVNVSAAIDTSAASKANGAINLSVNGGTGTIQLGANLTTGGGTGDITVDGSASATAAVTLDSGNANVNLNSGLSTASGTALINADTLTLTGAGDVGSSGTRVNTAVNTLVDNKSGGTAFLSELDGLNLNGAMSGSSLDLADAGTTTLNAALTAGAGDSVSLSGAVSRNGAGSILTAGTLTLAGTGNVGSGPTHLFTTVGTLNFNKTSGDSVIDQTGGVTLHGSSGTGNVTLNTTGDIGIDAAYSAAGGTLTANSGSGTLTLTGSGDVGSSLKSITTVVATLADNKTAGNAFISQSSGIILHGSTPGNLTLNVSGNTITIDSAFGDGGGGLLTAGTLALTGTGDVGSSGARANTKVGTLTDNKSGGTAFINQSVALNLSGTMTGSSLDLVNSATTTLNAALTAGAGDSVSLSGAVARNGAGVTLTAGTLTLAGTGNVGAGGTHFLTSVGTLIFNKSGPNSTFVDQTGTLTLRGSSAGNVTLTSSGDVLIDTAFSSVGGILTVNGGNGTLTLIGSGDVGSSGTPLSTAIATLLDNKTSGNTFISEANGLTLRGSTPGNLTLTAGGGNTITMDTAFSDGGGLLTAGTLALTGAGDVGSGGSRINTTVGTLTDNKTAGTAFINESDGLNLSGTMTGSSLDLVDGGLTTLNAALTAGAGDSISLSGAVSRSGGGSVLTAGTLNLLGSGAVGSTGTHLLISVGTLNFNKGVFNSFIDQSGGVTLHGSSGGSVTLNTTGDIGIDAAYSAVGGTLTANSGNGTLTLTGSGDVGSSVSPINTVVATLADNKASGNSFINQSIDVALQGSTPGNLTLNASGNTITIGSAFGDGGGLLTANTLALTGAGDVGSSGGRINTAVGALTDNKSSGTAFISESDGLNLSGSMTGSSLDLADGGLTTLNAALTAGAGDSVSLSGAVGGSGLLTAGTLTLAGAGNVGASGTPLNTAVDKLVFNKSSGSSFVNEANDLTLEGSSAGGVTVGTGGNIIIDTAYSAVGGTLSAGTLTLTGIGDVGSSGTKINTTVGTLVDNKSGGNAFISESDGLNLNGTFTGSSLNLADIGLTTLNGPLTAGVGDAVTLSGAVGGSGLLTAGTLTLAGTGNVGASGTPLNTAVDKLVFSKTSGNSFVSEADGLTLDGSSAGGVTIGTGGDIDIDAAYSAVGGTLTANSGNGTLTLSGSGDVGTIASPINVAVADLADNKASGNTFINELDDVILSGSTPGDLTLNTGGNILVNGALSLGGGMLTANGGNGTLILAGAGDVGSSGSFINTTIGTLNLSKSSGNVFIDEANALALQGSMAGNLDLVTHGNITQGTAPVVINGTATFAAGMASEITLENNNNDFNIVVITSAKDVSLHDANDISFGPPSSTISGNLSVSTFNGGNVNFDAGPPHTTVAKDLTVNAAGNLTGAVDVNGTKSITVGGVNNATLGSSLGDLLAAASTSIPLPRLNLTTFSGAAISLDEAAKLLPPGSIGTLWLQLPFENRKERTYKVEDVSKWTSGRTEAFGATAGPQTPK